MMKKIFLYLLIANFFVFPSYGYNNFADYNQDEKKILFAIKFSKNKKTNYYISYKNDDNISLKYKINKTKHKKLNYSGYQNVEGFKDHSKREEKIFAGLAIGVIAGTVILGALTIKAVIDAFE